MRRVDMTALMAGLAVLLGALAPLVAPAAPAAVIDDVCPPPPT